MEFASFLKQVRDLSLIETKNLLVGKKDPVSFLVQINRWVKTGKLIQIKRGAYLVAPVYRKSSVFEPFLASALVRPSYLSLEKALELHSMIPEAVTVFTSVTTKRPGMYSAENLRFEYRHIRASLFWGYKSVSEGSQTGFVAIAEKALLDLFYFHHGEITFEYLDGLRLQNLDKIDWSRLDDFTHRFAKPRIKRACDMLKKYAKERENDEILL